MTSGPPVPPACRPSLLPLLREIGDLKRVKSAGRRGSIADRAFARAWTDLAAGTMPDEVAVGTVGACLAATRLGDLDGEGLRALGLSGEQAGAIQREALPDVVPLLPSALARQLSERTRDVLPSLAAEDPFPFVRALREQPRAGATCPGRPRLVLGPPEDHAEHCVVVAVYAVLLAEPECDLGRVFLAALSHHLHNAAMPDAGYTGEMLLGRHLDGVMARATTIALAELPEPLAAATVEARRLLPDDSTAEGRAFHAADVLDRVLEIDSQLRRARVGLDEVLGDMALVHDGPVKPFHDRVLAAMGLA